MLVRRVYVPDDVSSTDPVNRDEWPYTIPCVAEILDNGLELTDPVTFLVGENGSGKSTLVEAMAEAYGLDARGGRAGRKYVNDRPMTPLGARLKLEMTAEGSRMVTGGRRRRRGYFLRAETAFGFMSTVSGMHGYWEEDITTMSHGEGFLTVLDNMFREPGLYLMDEPEAALSFTSCLRLIGLLHELGQSGAQVVCATHSPVLASVPDAGIIEVGDEGMRRMKWEDLDLVGHWRRYMADPRQYLRHVIKED